MIHSEQHTSKKEEIVGIPKPPRSQFNQPDQKLMIIDVLNIKKVKKISPFQKANFKKSGLSILDINL